MDMESNLKEFIIKILDDAIIKNKTILVDTDESKFRFYTDTCGQRKATLKIRSYNIPDYREKDLGKGFYTINRVLSFTNKVDEGKNDAILAEIDIKKFQKVSMETINSTIIIKLDFIIIKI